MKLESLLAWVHAPRGRLINLGSLYSSEKTSPLPILLQEDKVAFNHPDVILSPVTFFRYLKRRTQCCFH